MRAAMLAGSRFQSVDAWPRGMRLRCGRPWNPAFAGMTVKGTTGSRSVASNATAVHTGLDADIEAMAPGTMRPLQALPTPARRQIGKKTRQAKVLKKVEDVVVTGK